MGNTPKQSRVEDLQPADDVSSIPISDTIQHANLLATVSGLVFGFLTSIAVTYEFKLMIGEIIVSVALVSIATAIGIFLLPALYVQLHSPMDKQQKLQFDALSRKFILYGLVPFIVGVYCAVWLALWKFIEWFSPIVAAVIVIVPLTIYRLNRV